MNWIEKKYINLLSGRFRNFRWTNQTTANFSCPICGDSNKNPKKARGFILSKGSDVVYYCHNCSTSLPLSKFIETIDTQIHKEFTLEKFKESKEEKPYGYGCDDVNFGKFRMRINTLNSPSIISLPPKHYARKYIEDRKIPFFYYDKLFYTSNFSRAVKSVYKKYTNSNLPEDDRIIIPFYDEDAKIIGIQGRALNSTIRYVTCTESDSALVYGLNTTVKTDTVYVTEGPFDSMFLDNAIAMAGSNMDLNWVKKEFDDVVFVYDNEPTNKQICSIMKNVIDAGFSVVIWSNDNPHKDINEMVLNKYDYDKEIKNRTFNGLSARMEFVKWKQL